MDGMERLLWLLLLPLVYRYSGVLWGATIGRIQERGGLPRPVRMTLLAIFAGPPVVAIVWGLLAALAARLLS